jgi:hypothetical protein
VKRSLLKGEHEMNSDSPNVLAEILRTTLHLVERRQDLDQNAPSVTQLKESMRRTIAEVEQCRNPRKAAETDGAEKPSWSDVFRGKKRQ